MPSEVQRLALTTREGTHNMSAHGSISVYVYVKPEDAAPAERFVEDSDWEWSFSKRVEIGERCIFSFSDEAGWLADEMEVLAAELSKLDIPSQRWRAEVSYSSYEDSEENGGRVEFAIEDAQIVDFKESRLVMVPTEPWDGVGFSLENR